MKTTDLKQNFIIELNYNYLGQYINYILNKVKTLSESETEECNDEIILRSFKYYQNTNVALKLLGLILDNIKHSLVITICDKDNNLLKGEYDYSTHEVTELNMDDATPLYNEFNKIRNQCMVEAQKQVKYYKEYFTRLYDRSRTIK